MSLVPTLQLLGRLSTRVCSVCGNSCSFIQKGICEVKHPVCDLHFSSSKMMMMAFRSTCGLGKLFYSKPHPTMLLWTLLCLLGHISLSRKRLSDCSYKFGIKELSKMSWYAEALNVPGTLGGRPCSCCRITLQFHLCTA